MGLKFEFPVDKCPRPSSSSGWTSFEYKDWPNLREQFSEYVKQLPGIHAAGALLDAGTQLEIFLQGLNKTD